MIKVAIAGNIASGKSTVETLLKQSGYSVLDSDKVCHMLLEDSVAVCEAFSNYDVFTGGRISREKLGKLVFNNPDLKNKLEDLLYPDLKGKINEFFAQHSCERVVFAAVPLLYEAGMEDMFDKVIFVYCDDKIRLQRLIKRNNYTKEYALLRLNSQQSQEHKIGRADFVLYNNSSLEELTLELKRLVERIRLYQRDLPDSGQ